MAARDVLGNRRIAIFMSDLFLRNRVGRGYLQLTGYWKPLKLCGRMLKKCRHEQASRSTVFDPLPACKLAKCNS
jgi:hypothetical protein